MIRFLADADLNERIVAGCLRREPTMDFRSANVVNLEGVPDPKVLAYAETYETQRADLKTVAVSA